MGFWLTTAGAIILVAGFTLLALLRRTKEQEVTPAGFDLQVYRDQLKEVERDITRGILSEEEGERVRLEVSRRILDADKAIQQVQATENAPRSANLAIAALSLAVLAGGSLWLYSRLGAPNYPDMPLKARIEAADEIRETRPDQRSAEANTPPQPATRADLEPIVEQLREVVKERPDDLRGFTLLAGSEATLGNFKAAYVAQERVIELKGNQATAEDFAVLAEMMIVAAGGYVSPEAEEALNKSMQLDPRNASARYYAGLMFQQTGRPDLTFRLWRDLLAEGPEDAPWIAPIRAEIENLAALAGVEYQPPAPELRGPNAGDMSAAAEMSPEERQAMIEGMVEGLAERLATEGGTPAEWAQLINALGQLGQIERAAAIWGEAQQVFGANPDALEVVRRAAGRIGLTE